ncbi:MAG: YjbQ family protein [Propionibacteriaceae bacterium]|nr:YjbQ family protein [Propionibacteriaceae bacterium]
MPIDDGQLALGHLQRVYLVETDGPRHRKVQIRVLGQ